jgi:hypothetical protein
MKTIIRLKPVLMLVLVLCALCVLSRQEARAQQPAVFSPGGGAGSNFYFFTINSNINGGTFSNVTFIGTNTFTGGTFSNSIFVGSNYFPTFVGGQITSTNFVGDAGNLTNISAVYRVFTNGTVIGPKGKLVTTGTVSAGIQEAINDMPLAPSSAAASKFLIPGGGTIVLEGPGQFVCTGQIIIPSYTNRPFNLKIRGEGLPQVIYNGPGGSNFVITTEYIGSTLFNGLRLEVDNISWLMIPNTTNMIFKIGAYQDVRFRNNTFAWNFGLTNQSAHANGGYTYNYELTQSVQPGVVGVWLEPSSSVWSEFTGNTFFGLACAIAHGGNRGIISGNNFGSIGSFFTNSAYTYTTLWTNADYAGSLDVASFMGLGPAIVYETFDSSDLTIENNSFLKCGASVINVGGSITVANDFYFGGNYKVVNYSLGGHCAVNHSQGGFQEADHGDAIINDSGTTPWFTFSPQTSTTTTGPFTIVSNSILGLSIWGNLNASNNFAVNGTATIKGGGPALDSVLVSDAVGLAHWTNGLNLSGSNTFSGTNFFTSIQVKVLLASNIVGAVTRIFTNTVSLGSDVVSNLDFIGNGGIAITGAVVNGQAEIGFTSTGGGGSGSASNAIVNVLTNGVSVAAGGTVISNLNILGNGSSVVTGAVVNGQANIGITSTGGGGAGTVSNAFGLGPGAVILGAGLGGVMASGNAFSGTDGLWATNATANFPLFANIISTTGRMTNGSLTASTLVGSDANKALNSITVGSGLLLTGNTLSTNGQTTSGGGGAPTITQTNWNINQVYTVGSAPILALSSIVLIGPATTGSGVMAIMADQSGGSTFTTLSVVSNSVTTQQTIVVPLEGILKAGAKFYFTNSSDGTGATSDFTFGTGYFVTLTGATGPQGPTDPNALTNNDTRAITITGPLTNNGVEFVKDELMVSANGNNVAINSNSVAITTSGNATFSSSTGPLVLAPQNGIVTNQADLFVTGKLSAQFGFGGTNGNVPVVIYRNYNVSNDTSSSALSNLVVVPIPAASMGTNRAVHIYVAGDFLQNSGSSTGAVLAVTFGGTTNYHTGAVNTQNLLFPARTQRQGFSFEFILQNTGTVNSQSMVGNILFASGGTSPLIGAGFPNSTVFMNPIWGASTAIDTTSAQNFVVYWQWQSASASCEFKVQNVIAILE